MKGHKGKVNCLLYPYSQSKAYQSDYLLSGSSDFSVKLWDLYSGVLVHTFAVHGGEVKNIVSCPPDINVSTGGGGWGGGVIEDDCYVHESTNSY